MSPLKLSFLIVVFGVGAFPNRAAAVRRVTLDEFVTGREQASFGKTLRLAEQEMQLAQTRFKNGVADNREVIEAQNRLAVASDGLNDAVYQYNLSRVELTRAKGDVRGILAEKQ